MVFYRNRAALSFLMSLFVLLIIAVIGLITNNYIYFSCSVTLIETDIDSINYAKHLFESEHNDHLAKEIIKSSKFISNDIGNPGWTVGKYYKYYIFEIIQVEFNAENDPFNSTFNYSFTPCKVVTDQMMAR